MSKTKSFKSSLVRTVSFDGINVIETLVECMLLPGIPSFSIVGLGDKTINESKERVKSALYASEFSFPACKIIINLSPANLFKEGSHYDLPIALSILVAQGEIPSQILENKIIMGELGLNGNILPVYGVLPSVIFANKQNYDFVGAKENYKEMILPMKIFAMENLGELVLNLKKNRYVGNSNTLEIDLEIKEEKNYTFNKIYGQEIGKRALVIAAAGKHNLLLVGPKGVGKSMLSKSIIELLPDLTLEESLESTSIHSIAGALKDFKILKKKPFRSPHSSSSLVSIIGGGTTPKPGEISLAHNGILFLDELPEFPLAVIDSLRTPLEDGVVYLSRAKYKTSYPSKFQLIVSMNPCKCGNILDGKCSCRNRNYINKISGPIQDRIDIKVVLNRVNFSKKPENFIENVQESINLAIKRQRNRSNNLNLSGSFFNSDLSIETLENHCGFSQEILEYMQNLCTQREMSGRSYKKCLAVARTIADLENKDSISKEHVHESFFFVKNPFESSRD